jgi:hypothetical protein
MAFNPKNDGTLALMLEYNIPITRENYLMLAFAGNPPKDLDGETLEELRENGVGNIAPDTNPHEN